MIILHVETFQRLMPHASGSMVTNSMVVCPGVEQTYPFEATLFAHYHCTLTLQWMPEIIWNAPSSSHSSSSTYFLTPTMPESSLHHNSSTTPAQLQHNSSTTPAQLLELSGVLVPLLVRVVVQPSACGWCSRNQLMGHLPRQLSYR
jgi:hypothetical protein